MISIISTYTWMYIYNHFVVDIKSAIVDKALSIEYSTLDGIPTGTIEMLINVDASVLHDEIENNYIDIFQHLLSYMLSLFVVYSINKWISVILFFIVPISVCVNNLISKIIFKISNTLREQQNNHVSKIFEILKGRLFIKANQAERKTTSIISKETTGIIRTEMQKSFVQLSGKLINNTIYLILDISIYYLSFLFITKNSMTIGSFTAIFAYVAITKTSLDWLVNNFISTRSRNASIKRIVEFLRLPEEKGTSVKNTVNSIGGSIEFKSVSFGYSENKVLEQLSFLIRDGECVGLVGPNGAGKTTVTRLITKLYSPSSGNILINGTDVSLIDKESLLKSIGIISQKVHLFNGSIRYNLLLTNQRVDEDALYRACALAKIDDLIQQFPDGLDTQIGEHGVSLTTGQEQKLMIARLILHKPKIIILDEATSNIGVEDGSQLLRDIKALFPRTTTIVISHYKGQLEICDRLIELA